MNKSTTPKGLTKQEVKTLSALAAAAHVELVDFNTYLSLRFGGPVQERGDDFEKRIHFDGSRLCPNGHKLQFGVKGQGTRLVRESMLHRLGQ